MKKIIFALICTGALTLTSCQDWLDVNRDPNAATDATNGLIVPAAELNIITNYGLFANVLGAYYCDQWGVKPGGPNTFFFAQWDTKDGNAPATMADRFYTYNYVRVINNLKVVREKAKAEKKAGDYLVATVLRDFTYETMVDMFGEIPYFEAENPDNTSPEYDDGKTIYAELIADIIAAKDSVSKSQNVEACDNMLFKSSKDINNWVQFANALLLRLYMRESGVVDVKQEIQDLIDEDNFPTADICYGASLFTNEAGKENPVYNNYVRTAGDAKSKRSMDIVAHMCSIGTMGEYDDPRIPAKFKASVGFDTYEGGFITSQQSKETTAKLLSADTFAEPVLDYNTPIYLISLADTYFLLAEYCLNNSDDENAKTYYEKAIDASCAQCGVTGAEDIYGEGSPYAWNSERGMEQIGIQKWIANTGINGFESWCETRRLGYPELNDVSGEEAYAEFCDMAATNVKAGKTNPTPTCKDMVVAGLYEYGKIFTPTESSGFSAAEPYIQRMPYPESSKKTNAKAPAQSLKTTRIFWAE